MESTIQTTSNIQTTSKADKNSVIKYIKNRLDRTLLNDEDRKYVYKNHKNEYIFDYDFYKKIYLNELSTSKDECFRKMKTWKRIGCKEEYNRRYASNLRLLNKFLKKLHTDTVKNKIAKTIKEDETNLINIIVRTHRREQNFNKCIESIKNQTYKNIRLLVSVDDDYTQNYVEKVRKSCEIKNFNTYRFEPKREIGHWFNDYINFLFKEIKTGYVIIIDDDNFLSSDYCLEYLICTATHNLNKKSPKNTKTQQKDKPLVINFLYFRNDNFVVIDTSSVFFHSDILKTGEIKMGVHMGGDHVLMNGLKRFGKIIKVKYPLVRVTYNDYVTGGGLIFEN